MKTKKELLLYLTDKLGIRPHLEAQGCLIDLDQLNDNLSNLSEFPRLSAVLKDRDWLQKLVDEEKLIPCILMQSLIEASIYAGVESYKYDLWGSLQDQDSLFGIVDKISIAAE